MELIQLWKMILRRKWLFILIASVITIVPLIGSLLIDPIYEYKSKVWINLKSLQPGFVSDKFPDSLGKLSYGNSDNLYDTFIALIESRPVTEKVISDLDLKDKNGNPYDIKTFVEPSYIKRILTQKMGVVVERIEDSELFEIKAYSTDSKVAVQTANRVAEEFIRFFYDLNKKEADDARKFLEEKTLRTKTEWDKAEEERLLFKTTNIAVDIDKQKEYLLTELRTFRSTRADIEAQIGEKKATAVAAQKALEEQPEFKVSQTNMTYNPQLTDQKSKLFDYEASLAEKLTERKEDHPEIKIIQDKIKFAKKTIKSEIEKTFASEAISRNSYYDNLIQKFSDAEIDIISLTAKGKVVDFQIKRVETDLRDILGKELGYTRVSQDADRLKTLLSTLKTQLDEASLATELNVSSAVLVEKAKIPLDAHRKKYIYFPDKKLIAVISLFVGIILSICVVLFLEYIDNSFRSIKDIRDSVSRPVLATIPKLTKRRSEEFV